MMLGRELARACQSLRTRPEQGHWYRAVRPGYLETALQVQHTSGGAGRFHRKGGFPILYLVGSPDAALFEVQFLAGVAGAPGGPVPNPRMRGFTVLTIEAQLSAIVDLTSPETRSILQTTAQELTGDWRGYGLRSAATSLSDPVGDAPTQAMGAALFQSGRVEGFISYSARVPWEPILCVFPARIEDGNFVEYSWTDSSGTSRGRRIGGRGRTADE